MVGIGGGEENKRGRNQDCRDGRYTLSCFRWEEDMPRLWLNLVLEEPS